MSKYAFWKLYKSEAKWKCTIPTSQALADAQHQVSGGTTHQQESSQSLRNVDHGSCHPQASTQLVRLCHPNGLFKTLTASSSTANDIKEPQKVNSKTGKFR